MPTTEEVTKASGRVALSVTLATTYALKYGLNFTADLTKCLLGGAENMANYFTDNKVPKLGIGDFLLDKTLKGLNWGIDQTIKLQKFLKEKLR